MYRTASDSEHVFRAMADGTRRHILQLLARQELSVSELVHCLGQPQSTVSRHLKVLRDSSLIRDRRAGTAVLYVAQSGESAGNGSPASLQGRLVDWIGHEELPQAMQRRLEQAIERRENRANVFFSRIAERWDQMRVEAFGDSFHLEAFAGLLPSEWSVADIGTGTGFLLPILSRTFRKVIAIDAVPEMLEVATARCKARKLNNVVLKQGDMSRLPIPKQHVDLACAVLVLHHVASPRDALVELARILKPGGRLLIVEQKAHRLESFHERMQDRWWGFSPSKFAREISSVGFEDICVNPLVPESPGSPAMETPELFSITASMGDRAK